MWILQGLVRVEGFAFLVTSKFGVIDASVLSSLIQAQCLW